MSDEERDQNQGTPEDRDAEIHWGVNQRGDLIIDGTVVEKNPHGFGPEALPGASSDGPDELTALRQERDDLRQRFEEAEPFLRISTDPIMREILNERVARGEVEPPRSPAPAPEDVVGYHKRVGEPESASILHAMRQYAESLPDYQAQELNSNHRVWNAAYDRFKAAGAGSLPRPAMPASYPQVPMDRRTMETILRSKEVREARVEPPGGALPDYPDVPDDGRASAKEYHAQKAKLRRAYSDSGTPGDRDRAEQAMVEAYFSAGEPKSKRGGATGY